MTKEHDIEKIYEFLERSDFNELSEEERSLVLEHITESEYQKMRNTLEDTSLLLSKYPADRNRRLSSGIRKILTYPVELYKVAAVLIVLTGIVYFSSQSQSTRHELLAAADTVYVVRNDTILIHMIDSVEKIRERIVYRDIPHPNLPDILLEESTVHAGYEPDCSRDICPEDMASLSIQQTKGNLLSDSSLTAFFVSMN
jgi:hypothetical protein